MVKITKYKMFINTIFTVLPPKCSSHSVETQNIENYQKFNFIIYNTIVICTSLYGDNQVCYIKINQHLIVLVVTRNVTKM